MDKIIELLTNFEKEVVESNINNAQYILTSLLVEFTKYNSTDNLFNVNACSNNKDIKFIDNVQERINKIMPKYKKLASQNKFNKCLEQNNKINKKLQNINSNLMDFVYFSINVTPKLLNQNESFDANLSKYDKDYIVLLKEEKVTNKLSFNNKLDNIINKKNKILIITFDDRKNLSYIKIHNMNYKLYANKRGYDYKYEHLYNQNLNTNPYWYKIYLVKYYLDTNLYDYVIWVDSDTLIINDKIDINEYINSYSSDLFFCDDNQIVQKINAGMFIIKNSKIGRLYINDCINNFCDSCIKPGQNKLKGTWASTCYEQGIMNIVLIKKYMKYATILPLNMVFCSNNKYYFNLLTDVFIIHYYDSTSIERNILFDNLMKRKNSIEKLIEYSNNK